MNLTKLKNIDQENADILLDSYPDRLPVVIWCKDEKIKLNKLKYLVKTHLTCAQLLYVIRDNIITSNKGSQESLVMLIMLNEENDEVDTTNLKYVFVPMSETISILFRKYNVNGFLRLGLMLENVFG